MILFGSKDAHIWFCNKLDEKVYVVPAPEAFYAWLDTAKIAFDVVDAVAEGALLPVGAVASARALSRVARAVRLIKQAKKLKELYDVIQDFRELVSMGMENFENWQVRQQATSFAKQQLEDFFKDKAICVEPGAVVEVSRKEFLSSLDSLMEHVGQLSSLTPSYWATLAGRPTVTLLVTSASFERYAMYDSNADHSWIATRDGVVRARYGTLDVESPGDGSYAWTSQSRSASSLSADCFLLPGDSVYSPNQKYRLTYQADGDLTLRKTLDGAVLWASGTAGQGAWRTVLERNGDLVVYAAQGNAAWSCGAVGGGKLRLDVQGDGNVVLYLDGEVKWNTATRQPVTSELAGGQSLSPGADLQSPNRKYTLIYRKNGDLVLYRDDAAVQWATGTTGRPPGRLTLEPDGEVALYGEDGGVVWSSCWDGAPRGGSRSDGKLVLLDDGNLVAYGKDGNAHWSSLGNPRLETPTRRALRPGEFLGRRQALESASGRYLLLHQWDGSVVVVGKYTGEVRWRIGGGLPCGRFTFHGNGNVTLSEGSNVVWQAVNNGGLWGSGARLLLRDDGVLIVDEVEGQVLWASDAATALGTCVARTGAALDVAQTFFSPDGQHRFSFGGGLRPTLLDANGGAVQADWGTLSAANGWVQVSSRRYELSGRSWHTADARAPGARLMLYREGLMAFYAGDGTVVWASKPSHPMLGPRTTLEAGESLRPGQTLESRNGRFGLAIQLDGALALTRRPDGKVVWASDVPGAPGGLTLQDDGNLVLFEGGGGTLWSSRNCGGKCGPEYAGSRLVVLDEGVMLVESRAGEALWMSAFGRPPGRSYIVSQLAAGGSLTPGSSLESQSWKYQLLFQYDGNLVLYQRPSGRAVWSSDTAARNAAQVTLQGDGNLVITSLNGRSLWESAMFGGQRGSRFAGSTLTVQDDGDVTVKAPDGTTVWATKTAGAVELNRTCVGTTVALWGILRPEEFIRSPAGRYELVRRLDGNGELYRMPRREVVWVMNRAGGTSDPLGPGGAAYAWEVAVLDDGSIVCSSRDRAASRRINSGELPPESNFVGTSLAAGRALLPGRFLRSPNHRYELLHTPGGDLRLYQLAGGTCLWSSNTGSNPAGVACLQKDGSLHVITGDVRLAWSSIDRGGAVGAQDVGPRLELQDDGNAVVRSRDGALLWQSNTAQVAAAATPTGANAAAPPAATPAPKSGAYANLGNVLNENGEVGPGQFLESKNKRFRVALQFDGQLALRDVVDNVTLWSTRVVADAGRAVVQVFPGFAIYNARGEMIWKALDEPVEGAKTLTLQDDGNLVLTSSFGAALWQTGTTQVLNKVPVPAAAPNILPAGNSLMRGARLRSPNGRFELGLRWDACMVLVLQPQDEVLWQVGGSSLPPSSIDLTPEGALNVALKGTRSPAWTSLNAGGRAGRKLGGWLQLQDDGNAVVFGADGSVLWESRTAQSVIPPARKALERPASNALNPCSVLEVGRSLWSTNGRYEFVFLEDGNLALFDQPAGVVLWETGRRGVPWKLTLNDDLVAFDAQGDELWSSARDGARRPTVAGLYLTVQDDGDVTLRLGNETFWRTATPQSTLRSGQWIRRDQRLRSPNQRYELVVSSLTLTLWRLSDDALLWETEVRGHVPAARLILQPNGELALLSEQVKTHWSSIASGGRTVAPSPDVVAALQDDGDFVVKAPDGAVLWRSGTAEADASRVSDRITTGQSLNRGQALRSPDGRYELIYRWDGDVVLYHRPSGARIGSIGRRMCGAVIVQDDGNLVFRQFDGGVAWATNQEGSRVGPGLAGSSLQVRDDGNVVLAAPDGSTLWASNTTRRTPLRSVPARPVPRLDDVGASLKSGARLFPGQSLVSANRAFRVVFSFDGSVFVRTNDVAPTSVNVVCNALVVDTWLTLQDDANLVFQTEGRTLWASNTAGGKVGPQYAGSEFVVRNDGAAAVVAPDGEVLWSTPPAPPTRAAPLTPPSPPRSPPLVDDLPAPWRAEPPASASGCSANAAWGAFILRHFGRASYRFVYQPMSGDGAVQARVLRVGNSDPWAKAGVMIRESTGPGARFAVAALTPGNGITFDVRLDPKTAVSQGGAQPGVAAPHWVRLERRGNQITALRSADGVQWTQVGSATLWMGRDVLVGLALSSERNALNESTFDCVAIDGRPAAATPSVQLPAPWLTRGIGASGVGGAIESGGLFRVADSGADIAGAADAFRLVYRAMGEQGSVQARVVSVANTDPWAKAGVMIRESLAPGARFVMAVLTPGNGVAFQARAEPGADARHLNGVSNVAAPCWLKLTRDRDAFAAFTSADGTTWRQAGACRVPMGATVAAGLALASHSVAPNESRFDGVAVEGAQAGPLAPWQSCAVGAPGDGAVSALGASLSLTDSGAGLGGAADAFRFACQVVRGDGALQARAVSVTNTHPWAKAGVMLRESPDPGARFAMVAVTPGNGVVFWARAEPNAAVRQVGAAAGVVAPCWLRLVRDRDVVHAFQSTDGVGWQKLGAVQVALGPSPMAGPAASSNRAGVECAADFEEVFADWPGAARPDGLPAPWWTQAVGAPGAGGAGGASGWWGQFTLSDAGADIAGAADSFRFLFRAGGGFREAVQARVVSVANTHPWAKAGVMIRESLDPGARFVMAMVTPDNGLALQARTEPNADARQLTGVPGVAAPCWLKLIRSGDNFFASYSRDGMSWFDLGSCATRMAPPSYVGLALTSHSAALNVAGFEGVALDGAPPAADDPAAALPAPWANVGVGAAGQGGAALNDGVFTLGDSGADIAGSSDAFRFAAQPLRGDGVVEARVASVANTHPWAKAGVMIRESMDPGARFVLLALTPANGVAFQARLNPNADAVHLASAAGAAPQWLRLTRSGNTFTAARSANGTDWVTLGSTSPPMGTDALAGLALTSHGGGLNLSSFDNVGVRR